MFSSLMKTAGWDLKGPNDWTAFEEHLLDLHALWNDLWSSVIKPVGDRTYKLSFTPLDGCTFSEDHMMHIYTATSDVKVDSEDDALNIIGTISLGLSVNGSVTCTHSESPTNIPHTGVTSLQSAVNAQVVSVTDLERALAGEPFRIDLFAPSSTHREIVCDMTATQDILTEKMVDVEVTSPSPPPSSRTPIHMENPTHFNQIETEIINNSGAARSHQQVPRGLDCEVGDGMEYNNPSPPVIQGDATAVSNWVLAPIFSGSGGSIDEVGGSNAPLRRDLTKIELANTKRELERTRKELHRCRQELEQSKICLEQAIRENKNYARSIEELKSANAQDKEMYIRKAQHEIDNAKALVNNLRREFQGAQPEVFLTKADSLTIPDLSSQVTRLNEDIFQAAASLGEHVCRKQWCLLEEEAIRHAEDASSIIGPYLILVASDQARNLEAPVHPFLVQVILQAFLNAFCVEKMMMWTPDNRIGNDFLDTLYQSICENGKGPNSLSICYTDL